MVYKFWLATNQNLINLLMSDISAKSSPRIKEDSKLVEEEEGRWMCSSCTFSNVIELERCEMCDAQANLSHKKVKVEK